MSPTKPGGSAPDYSVGYGRPPEHSRFKKGLSGNPSGRRRYTDSERGKQLLREESDRLVSIREGDKSVRMSALRAAIRSTFYSAAKGRSTAQRLVFNLVAAASEADSANPTQITWLEPRWTVDDVLEQLDLTRLSDEQLTQFEQILEVGFPNYDEPTEQKR